MTSYHYECNVSEFFTQRVETVLQRYSQQCDLKGRGDRSNSGESALVCAELRPELSDTRYLFVEIELHITVVGWSGDLGLYDGCIITSRLALVM